MKSSINTMASYYVRLSDIYKKISIKTNRFIFIYLYSEVVNRVKKIKFIDGLKWIVAIFKYR